MLKTLQAGRALAAISVVAFHLSLMMGLPRYGGEAIFEHLTFRGYLGVDFFFVLSGFVILLAHSSDIGHPQDWGRYAYRRFIRLFPVYWLYTAIFVLLVALGVGTESQAPVDLARILTTTTLVKFSDGSPPLAVAWSLFHEVAFYAVFGLLILHKRLGIAVFAAWTLTCLVFFHFSGDTPLSTYTAAFNLYSVFGMGAYHLYQRGGNGIAEGLAGVVVVALSLAFPLEHTAWRIALMAGFTLILAGLAKIEKRGLIKVPRSVVYMGNASYSIYLTHVAFSGLLLKLLYKAGASSALGGVSIYLLVLAGTVVLGCLSYQWVERPLLHRLRSRQPKRTQTIQRA